MKRVATLFGQGLVLGLLFLTWNSPALAQAKPNFTGTWSLDKSRSKFGRLAKEAADVKLSLRITHREPELKIIRSGSLNGQGGTQNLTYFTDERGESNPGLLNNSTAQSKTKWEGARLTSRSLSSVFFNGQSFQLETIERRELSADRKSLTLSVIASSPRGIDRLKLVFTRQ
jgi:hypothetical protein